MLTTRTGQTQDDPGTKLYVFLNVFFRCGTAGVTWHRTALIPLPSFFTPHNTYFVTYFQFRLRLINVTKHFDTSNKKIMFLKLNQIE